MLSYIPNIDSSSTVFPVKSLIISKHKRDLKKKKINKGGRTKFWELNPTWIEHATFWSGVRRATIAPRIHGCEVNQMSKSNISFLLFPAKTSVAKILWNQMRVFAKFNWKFFCRRLPSVFPQEFECHECRISISIPGAWSTSLNLRKIRGKKFNFSFDCHTLFFIFLNEVRFLAIIFWLYTGFFRQIINPMFTNCFQSLTDPFVLWFCWTVRIGTMKCTLYFYFVWK